MSLLKCPQKSLLKIRFSSLFILIVWLNITNCALRIQAQVTAPLVNVVSGASYEVAPVAPGSIVSAFGMKLATSSVAATDIDPSTPQIELPTNLAGTTVMIDGKIAQLLFISPTQVNFIMPNGLDVTGTSTRHSATVKIIAGDGVESNGAVEISKVSPAIFTSNADSTGVMAGNILRIKADGSRSYEPVAQYDDVTKRWLPKPIEFGGEEERLFLEIYLTGIRNDSGSFLVIRGTYRYPAFQGSQGYFVGLDQINFELPRTLSNVGRLDVSVYSSYYSTASGFPGGSSNWGYGFTSKPVQLQFGSTKNTVSPVINSTESAGKGWSVITGVVTDLDGITPVANAKITVLDAGGVQFPFEQRVVFTDDSGSYVLRNIERGSITADIVGVSGQVARKASTYDFVAAIGKNKIATTINFSLKN